MENELIKIEAGFDLMTLAKTFAESGMFADTKNVAQCIVKIQAGQELGIPPFAAMSGIHIIMGKTIVGAGLIASRIKASGKYDYKVLQQDEKACSIDVYENSAKIGNSTFTIEDAKKAGTKNIEKYPKNMLFARAISNAAKWFCPDVFTGPVYVEGEIEDVPHRIVIDSKESEEQPKLEPNELTYRTATTDPATFEKLVNEATDVALLRAFRAVNSKLLKEHPELDAIIVAKGKALKELSDTNNPLNK